MIGHELVDGGLVEAGSTEERDGCLVEDSVLRLLAGEIAGDQLQKVEAHLDSCVDCRRLVALAGAHLRSVPRSDSRPVLSESLAEIIDGGLALESLRTIEASDYRVEKELARGGMGRVLLAIDRQGRRVAIKMLLNPGKSAALRFLREMQVTSALQHPSIVILHEAGRWPSGEPFFAMKLVEGRSLWDELAARPSVKDRMALVPRLIAVTDALAYAHDRGVIHRDLKPSNILVGAFGETVVIDWGLARVRESFRTDALESGSGSAPAAVGATEVGAALGTPAYMPPEQARGDAVDERADVYGLGAILYHLLCGEPPHTGASGREVLAKVLAGPPRALAERVPEIPPDLVAIVSKAMMPDPGERYPTAKEMAEDLRRFSTGQLVSVYAYSSRALAARWFRKNRAAVTVAVVLVGLGMLAAGASVARILQERNRAEAQTVVATTHQGGAERLVEYLIVQFRDRVRKADRIDLLEGLGDEVSRYYRDVDGAGIPVEPASLRSRASALETLGAVEYQKRNLDKARALFTQAIELWRRVSDTDTSAADLVRQGAVWQQLGRLEDSEAKAAAALEACRRAIELADRAAQREPESSEGPLLAANSLAQMSGTLDMLQNDPEAALQATLAARERVAALYARHPDDSGLQGKLAALHQRVGRQQLHLRRLDDAAESLRNGIQLHSEALKQDAGNATLARESAYAFYFWSNVELFRGHLTEALAAANTFVERLGQSVRENPGNQTMRHDLSRGYGPVCEIQRLAGQLEAAEAACVKRVSITRDLLQGDRKNGQVLDGLVNALVDLGRVQAAQARHKLAQETLLEAVTVLRGQLASDPDVPRWQENLKFALQWLADVELQRGNSADAAAHADEALALARKLDGGAHASPDAEADMAGLEILRGDIARAQHSLDQARSRYESARSKLEHLVQQSPSDVSFQVTLAEALAKLARVLGSLPAEREAARQLREQALATLDGLQRTGRLFAEHQPLRSVVTRELRRPEPASL